jgi:hypothetical protein
MVPSTCGSDLHHGDGRDASLKIDPEVGCAKTPRSRPLTHTGSTHEIIFECEDCGLSLIEAATPAEVFAAAAR